jgi:hypothetical protein
MIGGPRSSLDMLENSPSKDQPDNQSTTVMIVTELSQLDIMQLLKVKLYQNKNTSI